MSDAPAPSVIAEVTGLPWYRESAWRAWVKGTLADFSIAVGVSLGVIFAAEESKIAWWVPLAIAGGNAVKNFLAAAFDIFWGGQDVYQSPAPVALKMTAGAKETP